MEAVTPEMIRAVENLAKTVGVRQQDILTSLSEHEIEVWVQYAIMGKSVDEIRTSATERWNVVDKISVRQIDRLLARARLKMIGNIIGKKDAQEFLSGNPEAQAVIDKFSAVLEEEKEM